MKTFNPLLVSHGRSIAVECKYIEVQGIEFVVSRDINSCHFSVVDGKPVFGPHAGWAASEPSTGLSAAMPGKTQKEAVDNLERRINHIGVERIREMIGQYIEKQAAA